MPATCLFLSATHFVSTPPPSFFIFFWSLLTFPKKSPKQVQQALAPGFLLPFQVSEVPCISNKKPELRKYDLLNPGFLVQNRYLCQSAKDPVIFYFFRIS